MYKIFLDMSSRNVYDSCMIETRENRKDRSQGRGLPPYLALAESLRRRIAAEGVPPGGRLDSEVGIAEKSGLSRMTVRRAVQELVDAGLLERRAGRGVFVRGGEDSACRIVFLAGDLLWMPAVRVSHGVQEAAPEARFQVDVFDARGRMDAFLERLAELPASAYSGAVVMSQHGPDFNRALAALVAEDFPFVVVDQALNELPAPSVAADNRTGGRLAAGALLAAGHRRLAFFGDRADTSLARALGTAEACAAAGAPPPLDITAECARFADWAPVLAPPLRAAMASVRHPTAIVCSCDAVARIAYRVLAEEGIGVPQDVSLTGFDDDPIAEWMSPPLTTIRQDFAEMGRKAVAALASRLAAGPSAALDLQPRSVPVSLVERGSIAPPPHHHTSAAS